MSKSLRKYQMVDALLLKNYPGFWIVKSKLLPFKDFKILINASVDHVFGTHE